MLFAVTLFQQVPGGADLSYIEERGMVPGEA
jgi:hypothetical protein